MEPSILKVQNLTTARSLKTYLTLQIISTKTLEFTETNSYFYSYTFEKTYLAVLLTIRYIFVNLLTDRKIAVSTPKYSLLAGNLNQASNFFLLTIPSGRNECKQHTEIN